MNDIGDIYLNIGYLYGSKNDTLAERNYYLKAKTVFLIQTTRRN